jgi:hypothetical protein
MFQFFPENALGWLARAAPEPPRNPKKNAFDLLPPAAAAASASGGGRARPSKVEGRVDAPRQGPFARGETPAARGVRDGRRLGRKALRRGGPGDGHSGGGCVVIVGAGWVRRHGSKPWRRRRRGVHPGGVLAQRPAASRSLKCGGALPVLARRKEAEA